VRYLTITEAQASSATNHLASICNSTPGAETIRILLMDEQVIVRKGLRLLIEEEFGFIVVGEAGNKEEVIDIAVREQPNIILFEFLSSVDSSFEILEELSAVARDAHIIILTSQCDPKIHQRALSFGARGVVVKQAAPETLSKAIHKVHEGEMWIERSTTASIFAEMLLTIRSKKTDPEARKIATLTRREREVVTFVAKGLKNKQIAKQLFISEATVSHHLTSIFNKLDTMDRLQLIVYAYQHHLADTDP
jgi:two-component system nitrate/nitrite response regulator NarL